MPTATRIAGLVLGFWLYANGAEAAPEADPRPRPPPINTRYAQYGVALTGEVVVRAADVCPSGGPAPCILGSGAGAAARGGYRSAGPWYVGGAYEFSRQDSSNLLRLGILQQLRVEARYHFDTGTRYSPYVAFSLGAAVYGNEFGADTGGLTAHVGGGMALEVSRTTLIGVALGYRPLLLSAWTDSAGQRRADAFFGLGLAHLLSLEMTFDVRRPLPRW